MTFETRKTQAQLRQKVKDNWACWRLIYCDIANFTYDEVFHHMTPQEISEANVALDIVEAEIKRKMKK